MSTLASKTITSRSNIIKIIIKIVRQSPNSTYCPQYNRKQDRSTRYGAISLAQSAYIQRNGNFSNYVAATHDQCGNKGYLIVSCYDITDVAWSRDALLTQALQLLNLIMYYFSTTTTRSSQPLPMIFSTIINIIIFNIIELNTKVASKMVEISYYFITLCHQHDGRQDKRFSYIKLMTSLAGSYVRNKMNFTECNKWLPHYMLFVPFIAHVSHGAVGRRIQKVWQIV